MRNKRFLKRIIKLVLRTLEYNTTGRFYLLFSIKVRRKILSYRDYLVGDRVWIVGTGSSLRIEDIERLINKGEKIILVNAGVTLSIDLDFQPVAYFCTYLPTLEEYKTSISKLKCPFFTDIIRRRYCKKEKLYPVYYCGILRHPTKDKDSYNENDMRINKDIFKHGVNLNGITVTAVATQFAMYMGAKEIIYLGCDCGQNSNGYYFNSDKVPPESIDVDASYRAFNRWMKCANDYGATIGVKLYNATRGGGLNTIERVEFDKYMETI